VLSLFVVFKMAWY